ncbi:MAG: AAA family ATPase [Sandaracinaceae bacterium]
MYLHTLRLENLKLLDDDTFSFTHADGTPRLWTVLLGDNGLCKTSVLQAIAIAASGDKLARALVGDAADYVRATETERGAKIVAELRTRNGPVSPARVQDPRSSLEVEMRVEPGKHDFDGHGDATWVANLRSERAPGLFVVGYGVGRYLPRPGEVAVSPDPVHDRVEGLFDTRHKMLGVDFFTALRQRNGGDRELARAYARRIRDVLIATDPTTGERLLPWLSGVELRGYSGVDAMERLLESQRFELEIGPLSFKLAPHQLSQGYQSVIAWISDLLGHAFLERGADVDPAELEGIVLLDEIDLHLHPTWQRRVVPILRSTFPRLQFVVTTHSPLVLTGFESDEILQLQMHDDGLVRVRQTGLEPAAQSASQLLTSYFDVPVAARPDVAAKERDYLELKAKDSRTDDEDARLTSLGEELERYFASPLRDPRGGEHVQLDDQSVAALPLEERIRDMEAKVRAVVKSGGS